MQAIALRDSPGRFARATIPWIVLVLLLAVAAGWILFQPMDMRGMGLGG
jgi:hypothetical protein